MHLIIKYFKADLWRKYTQKKYEILPRGVFLYHFLYSTQHIPLIWIPSPILFASKTLTLTNNVCWYFVCCLNNILKSIYAKKNVNIHVQFVLKAPFLNVIDQFRWSNSSYVYEYKSYLSHPKCIKTTPSCLHCVNDRMYFRVN